jgi:hypothetical protein
MIKKNNSLVLYLNHIQGSAFYIFEYYIYLNEHNLNFDLIIQCSNTIKIKIIELYKEKYKTEYIKYLKNIKFVSKRQLIITNNLIILDYSTYNQLYRTVLYKKCFYHYTDSFESLSISFKEYSNYKNIIPFGDSIISKDEIPNFPLYLNFKMFKPLKNIQSKIWIDNKPEFEKNHRHEKNGFMKNFHCNFYKVIINRRTFERANRLIPECKFYNKEILIKDNRKNKIFDSIDIRLKKDWTDFDINNSNFAKFIKDNI